MGRLWPRPTADPPNPRRQTKTQVEEWAQLILGWAATYGASDSVMLLEDLSSGDDVRGTELQGLHREVLLRALKALEAQGKVRCAALVRSAFTGSNAARGYLLWALPPLLPQRLRDGRERGYQWDVQPLGTAADRRQRARLPFPCPRAPQAVPRRYARGGGRQVPVTCN